MKVGVVGLGKLGLPLALMYADVNLAGNPTHEVSGFDANPAIADALWKGECPIDEPGVAELLGKHPLQCFASISNLADWADVVFIVVPTPSDMEGRFDASAVVEVAKLAGRAGKLLIVSSTVMPGTIENEVLPVVPGGARVIYSPEFIALGSVLNDMTRPDLILIGGGSRTIDKDAVNLLRSITTYGGEVCWLTWREAEIAKIALNAYVTMKISFANMIGLAAGPSAVDILDAIGCDRRIGHEYLRPGGPFGGPCFPRDNRAFAKWLASERVTTVMSVATDRVNRDVIEEAIGRLLRYRTVAILGLAYKSGTAVWEHSFGVRVAEVLLRNRVSVLCHDPKARPAHLQVVDATDVGVDVAGSAQLAIDAADAVLIATEHLEYVDLNFAGKVLVDPWGLIR